MPLVMPWMRSSQSSCSGHILIFLPDTLVGVRQFFTRVDLTLTDISINEQLLSVHQSMQRVQTGGQDGKKTRVVIQSPKSSCSIRRIPIPFEIHKLLVASQKQADAFLLTGLPDRFMEPRCLENRFKAAASACEIYNVNYHTLRHTFATRCVELGFDIKSLSEILGHASVNITMNRYVHPSMEFKKENMNRLSAKYTDALFYK